MIYTIAGGFGGMAAFYVIGKVASMDFQKRYFNAPSPGGIFVLTGALIGACVGFGVGATRLATGHYLSM